MKKCKAHGYGTKNDTSNDQYEDEYESEIENDTELEEKESDSLDTSGFIWLDRNYNEILGRSSPRKKLRYDLFQTLVQTIYPANVLQEASGMITPLGKCPSELDEDMKWYKKS